MFEQNQKEVEALMQSNAEFRSLYQRHKELDSKVRDAELGVLPMDDVVVDTDLHLAGGKVCHVVLMSRTLHAFLLLCYCCS